MSAEPDVGFERLLEYVRDARGFDYSGYRRPTLIRRFQKRMQTVGADDWDSYRSYLAEHPEEYASLFNAILINVTGFFRDPETWQLIESEVIPKILERKSDGQAIRVWSAGCASGEEPYSIAMLFADAVGDDGFKERVKIYATDIDEEALAQAREARYEPEKLKEVSPERLERYFTPNNHGYVFRNDLRRCVIFGRNDLHRDPPISRVDLLLARNTLMYFSPELQDRIVANFHFALTPGGFFVVGKAEGLHTRTSLFVPYNLKRRIFMRNASAEGGFRVLRASALPDTDDQGQVDLGEAAFEHAPVAQLVLDDENRLAAVNHSARALFGLKLKDIGRPLQDLEVSYRPLELRSLIDEVRKHRRPSTAKDVEWQAARGRRTFDVQVAPLTGPGTMVAGIGISFVDTTAHRSLEEQLERARRELQAAYEELQSTVEELETTNEELQSTNEELETTNEELQSTNEELETMNEELQSTNEELETMNDEMRERTDETARANSFLGSVLASMQQAVVVVDRELRVLAWSEQAADLWGLRDDEVEGAHLLNLDIGLPVQELREPIRMVLGAKTVEPIALEGHNRRGQRVRYSAEFAPLLARNPDDGAAGVIMLLTAEREGEFHQPADGNESSP
ncbi:MAG: PAS domain S-box protein [Actinobacteria bacterium]|nr:PAS domain S-box protein [Actinomycetota bacterium]